MTTAPGGEPGSSSALGRRRRVQSWLYALAFVALSAGTVVGTLWARADAVRAFERGGDAAGAPELGLARFVAVGGSTALVAMLALMVVTGRHQRRLAAANELLVRRERQSRAVQEVTGRLARALSGDEVVSALLEHLPAGVGAASAVIAMVDDDDELELLRGPVVAGRDGERAEVVEDPGAIVELVRSRREAEWHSSPMAWRDDPAAASLAGRGWAMALLPLAAADVVGVLAVSYPRVHIFADEERALLETLGVLAAGALARGRRYDEEHRAAVAFQRSALPSQVPEVPGLSIAARYRPGAHEATVGGDWYDVLVLDDHRVLLVVGDVVGHGMDAAAAMGRLRTAFQFTAALRPEPGALVRTISQQAASIPNSFCTTVVCVLVDLDTGSMTWSRAGHPPPVLLAGREVRLLDGPGVPPLGVAPDSGPVAHSVDVQAGDLLVLYSDGVVERREESLDVGLERLRIVVESLADLGPEDLVEALLEAMVPVEEQNDDVVALVVRVDPPSPGRS